MERYDADSAPDPAAWLALDEQARIDLVGRHHRGRVERTLHADGYNRRVHLALHAVVENQIAAHDPPATGKAVARLCAEGLRRHAAIHAVGEVLLRWMASGTSFDGDTFAAALGALSAGDWLGERMRRDLGPPDPSAAE